MTGKNGQHPKRYKPRLYTITFGKDSEFADLEAKVKGASVDTLLNLLEAADDAQDVADGQSVTDRNRKAVAVMIAEFAPLVHWWNVDDADGNPVTPDEAGLRSQDFGLVMALFNAWQQRFAVVAPPLPQGSNDGPDTDMEALMPMEIGSPSPVSS